MGVDDIMRKGVAANGYLLGSSTTLSWVLYTHKTML